MTYNIKKAIKPKVKIPTAEDLYMIKEFIDEYLDWENSEEYHEDGVDDWTHEIFEMTMSAFCGSRDKVFTDYLNLLHGEDEFGDGLFD